MEAVKFLADRAGIALPEAGEYSKQNKGGLKASILGINKISARYYMHD